jgi:2-dehydro-3-deoxyphosphogluconate aldolase / (4S)-4-hydroxy-2-oxoglutarate aldolase
MDWHKELRSVRALPVIVIEDVADAVPMCRALLSGGLRLLEVTLRTPVALEAIERVAKELPEASVSPGATDALLQAAAGNSVPLIPGCSSASDIMRARDYGYRLVKFFPAEAVGGVAALKSYTGPFPDQLFVPTGGITAEKADQYRALPQVLTVGGSWMLPADAIKAKDWEKIETLAKAA